MRFRFFAFALAAVGALAFPPGARAGHYTSVAVVNDTSRYVEAAAVDGLARSVLSVCVAPKASHTMIVGTLAATVESMRFEVKSHGSCQASTVWIRERAVASKITVKEEKGKYTITTP